MVQQKKGVTADNTLENKLRKSHIKLIFQQRMIFQTKEWYITEIQDKGKKIADYQKEFKRDNWHKTININANEIKTMNRILTGHDYSKYWLKNSKQKKVTYAMFAKYKKRANTKYFFVQNRTMKNRNIVTSEKIYLANTGNKIIIKIIISY